MENRIGTRRAYFNKFRSHRQHGVPVSRKIFPSCNLTSTLFMNQAVLIIWWLGCLFQYQHFLWQSLTINVKFFSPNNLLVISENTRILYFGVIRNSNLRVARKFKTALAQNSKRQWLSFFLSVCFLFFFNVFVFGGLFFPSWRWMRLDIRWYCIVTFHTANTSFKTKIDSHRGKYLFSRFLRSSDDENLKRKKKSKA